MNKLNYIIASQKSWHKDMPARLEKALGSSFHLVSKDEDLRPENLVRLQPRYIFFPHWSSLIPSQVYENYECVIFHMTDLPFGRGGSPLQNLISRGIYETKVSALKCSSGLDTGPIYCKKPLSLHGSAEEIFLRAASVIEEMIELIVKTTPTPVPQEGEAVVFKRKKPEESNLERVQNLNQFYDQVRMLDAQGYPPAFLDFGPFRITFKRISKNQHSLIADAEIVERITP